MAAHRSTAPFIVIGVIALILTVVVYLRGDRQGASDPDDNSAPPPLSGQALLRQESDPQEATEERIRTRKVPDLAAACMSDKEVEKGGMIWKIDYGDPLRHVVYQEKGQLLGLAEIGFDTYLLHLNSGIERALYASAQALAFTPDGGTLALAETGQGARVSLWRTSTGEKVKTLQPGGDTEILNADVLVYSPRGKLLAVGTDDGVIHLWKMPVGEPLRQLKGHKDYISALAFNPAGTLLASSAEDGTVRLWNLATGQQERSLKLSGRKAWELAFSPSGEILAAAGWEGAVHLWQMPGGRALPPLKAGKDMARALAVSPDSKLLAAGGGDHAARLWHLPSGKLIHRFEGHEGEILGLTFISGGAILVTVSFDQSARFWCVPRR